MSLITSLHKQLQENAMPFVDFMQMALYDPRFGYYTSGLQKFGSQGDFITAPELTPLFGQALASQCQQIFHSLKNPILFEFGAGSGRLCVDILQHLEHLQCLPDAYHILEVSGNLRQRQQSLIEQEIPHLIDRVKWLDRWPENPFNGVIIANEVLDAMPVHRFYKAGDALYESFVGLNAEGKIAEFINPCATSELTTYLQTNLPDLATPYQSEVNLFIGPWMKQCSEMLIQGAMILIDYGFPRHEYYHPDRQQGTLMCHYRHQAHSNPLIHIGEQDITAHVDFTHVAEAAHDSGFHVAGYTSQAAFLLSLGLLNLLEAIPDSSSRIKAQQAIKILTQPTEMGELFKVIALTKNRDIELAGFQLHDKRVSL